MLEHIDAVISSWHEFKNYWTIEIRPLHLQPFTNSHFHFPIIVDLAASYVLLQWPKKRAWQGKVRTVGWMVCKFPVK
jgi:hypothetical protein